MCARIYLHDDQTPLPPDLIIILYYLIILYIICIGYTHMCVANSAALGRTLNRDVVHVCCTSVRRVQYYRGVFFFFHPVFWSPGRNAFKIPDPTAAATLFFPTATPRSCFFSPLSDFDVSRRRLHALRLIYIQRHNIYIYTSYVIHNTGRATI